MPADAFFLLAGGCLLLAVLLPAALHSYAVSPPLVLLVVGVALGWTPLADDLQLDLDADRALVEHVTELTVLIALMGVGLALDRPLDLLRPASWRAWSPTWVPCWHRPTRCSPPTCRSEAPARRSPTRPRRTCRTRRTRP